MTTSEIIRSVGLSNQGRVRDLRITPAQVLELIGAGYCVAPAGRDGCTVYAPNWRGDPEIVMPKKSTVDHQALEILVATVGIDSASPYLFSEL